MPLFEWNSSFSVSIQKMDEEHQKLFGIMNSLYDAMKAGKSKEVMENVFQQLLEYTKVHFADEEVLMKQNNYPGLNDQLSQHRAFEGKMQEQYARFKSGAMLVSIDVMNFLKDWLLNHIMTFDKKYGVFLNAKGIK